MVLNETSCEELLGLVIERVKYYRTVDPHRHYASALGLLQNAEAELHLCRGRRIQEGLLAEPPAPEWALGLEVAAEESGTEENPLSPTESNLEGATVGA